MKAHIITAATVILATASPGAQDSSAATGRAGAIPQWERALVERSRGLDQRYQLGSFRPIGAGLGPVTAGHPGWLRALRLRSQGLDRVHHLGSFTRTIAPE
jgi:hypothetical protein